MHSTAKDGLSIAAHNLHKRYEGGLGHREKFVAPKLSCGERQLTAVAGALVGEPNLVLADEPTGSVDTETGDRMLELLLLSRLTESATVVLVNHYPRLAARAGRIIAMLDGRAAGPVAETVSAGRTRVNA